MLREESVEVVASKSVPSLKSQTPRSGLHLGTAMLDITCLPKEVLENVFERLSIVERIGAERVCRQWTEVLRKGGGWAKLTSLSSSNLTKVLQEEQKKRRYLDRLACVIIDRAGRFLLTVDLALCG